MKRWLWLATGLMVMACEPQARQQSDNQPSPPAEAKAPVWEPERISVEELKKLTDGKNPPYIVDVRNAEAFKRSHIQGAISVPGPDHFGVLSQLKKDHLMVLYCT